MPSYRHLLFALLPLFAGCQVFIPEPAQPASAATTSRLQGTASLDNDQLLFTPCKEQRKFLLTGDQAAELSQQVSELAHSRLPLFADLNGDMQANKSKQLDGQIEVSRLYRLQSEEGRGCDDLNFARLLLRANGHEPEWNINVSSQGLVLERMGQPALPLPYLEEQMPDGRFFLATEANGMTLTLWLNPTQCTDSMTGAIQHLSAELQINDKVMRGCAAFGAKRND